MLGMDGWIRQKLSALVGKEKDKKPPYKPPERKYRLIKPWWIRNMMHYTASAISRGRTLQPHAVARAMHWRADRIKELTTKLQGGTATPKEIRELRRISS